MIDKYRIMTNRILNEMVQTERAQRARFAELKEYDGLQLKPDKVKNGITYYAVATGVSKDGRRIYDYLGKDINETVKLIKEARYLKKSLKIIDKNIRALNRVLAVLKEVDSESINRQLPKTYRGALHEASSQIDPRAAFWKKDAEARKAAHIAAYGVYHPEELNVPTDDGTMVRSKSEALIYNLLLRMGITFVYELPLKMKYKTRFPDFTLLSEVDFRTEILIEHQGKMKDAEYRGRHSERIYDYLCEGYVAGVNIFYTYDDINGGLNTNVIHDIIKLKIRPPEISQSD